MILIRRFEEATEREFRKGKIGGYLHVYSGQEAVATGVLSALRPDDVVFAGYRDHAHTLVLGSDPNRVMAELFGKGSGLSKGKGGSMHLFDVEHGFYGGYGIVGGHLTLAAGAAYALRYRNTERIAV
ncbi:MAG: Pyruvate dehydrogenase (lipoamide), partial [Acidobacteria bacterium]|nr:Pyruvate dehydrogenase (lipoamide) [Acidobacteriota bacterium]